MAFFSRSLFRKKKKCAADGSFVGAGVGGKGWVCSLLRVILHRIEMILAVFRFVRKIFIVGGANTASGTNTYMVILFRAGSTLLLFGGKIMRSFF